jgi:hypothetical protein
VFGGPPRYGSAGPPPLDYAEVFGGVAATCSIPYLDLPPVAVGAGDGDGDGGFFSGRGGAGDYGEIFGRFGFADFAAPYEELFGVPRAGDRDAPFPASAPAPEEEEEIASSSGSSSRFVPALPALLPVRLRFFSFLEPECFSHAFG